MGFVFYCFSPLSVPVQMSDWKYLSLKWPGTCWWGCRTILSVWINGAVWLEKHFVSNSVHLPPNQTMQLHSVSLLKKHLHHKFITETCSMQLKHTKMELHIFNFYCTGLPMPSQLTWCCDYVVYEVVGNLHQQLWQHNYHFTILSQLSFIQHLLVMVIFFTTVLNNLLNGH